MALPFGYQGSDPGRSGSNIGVGGFMGGGGGLGYGGGMGGGSSVYAAMLRRKMLESGAKPGMQDPFLDEYGQPAERIPNLYGRSGIGLDRLQGMREAQKQLMGGTYGPRQAMGGMNQGFGEGMAGGGVSDILRRLLMSRQGGGGL